MTCLSCSRVSVACWMLISRRRISSLPASSCWSSRSSLRFWILLKLEDTAHHQTTEEAEVGRDHC